MIENDKVIAAEIDTVEREVRQAKPEDDEELVFEILASRCPPSPNPGYWNDPRN